jgi:hypothetical protein
MLINPLQLSESACAGVPDSTLLPKIIFFLCVSDTQSRCIDMHPTWELLLFLLTFLVWTPSVESTLLANEARH